MSARIAVVSAGLRTPSSTRLLADDLTAAVRDRLPDAQVTQVELRDHAHALADALLTGFPAGALAEALATVAGADGVVVVTPTYSASYSGLMKTFFDVLEPDALRGTPVLLAATGGTERHSLMLDHAMRPLFSYLHAVPLPTGVYAATADFGGEESGRLGERIARAVSELSAALGEARATAAPAERVVPFEELMKGLGR